MLTDGRGPMTERLQGLYRALVEADVGSGGTVMGTRTFSRKSTCPTVRIAMWSGPRNLSTAMLRSFGNRADTAVSDEPFYGAFLKTSGAPHPMAAEVIAAMDCDWASVARTLAGPAPGGQADLVPEADVAPYGRAGRL